MTRSFFSTPYTVIHNAVQEFIEDEVITRAGALAFFGIFSIPPLLIIILNVVSFFAGPQMANSELFSQIRLLWGERLASLVHNLITNYTVEFKEQENTIRSIWGLLLFLFSSTSFFLYIQYSLNSIWDVKHKPKSTFLKLIKNRLFSLGLILVLIILILASVLLDSFLIVMHRWMDTFMSVDAITSLLFGVLGSLISYLFAAFILAFIFKYLPDVSMKWEVALAGAGLTSLLFGIGKLAIGFFLSHTHIEGTYGIVGSLILVMLWVYYSAAILYFGAELTQQYGIVRSKEIHPGREAVRVVSKEIKLPKGNPKT